VDKQTLLKRYRKRNRYKLLVLLLVLLLALPLLFLVGLLDLLVLLPLALLLWLVQEAFFPTISFIPPGQTTATVFPKARLACRCRYKTVACILKISLWTAVKP